MGTLRLWTGRQAQPVEKFVEKCRKLPVRKARAGARSRSRNQTRKKKSLNFKQLS